VPLFVIFRVFLVTVVFGIASSFLSKSNQIIHCSKILSVSKICYLPYLTFFTLNYIALNYNGYIKFRIDGNLSVITEICNWTHITNIDDILSKSSNNFKLRILKSSNTVMSFCVMLYSSFHYFSL